MTTIEKKTNHEIERKFLVKETSILREAKSKRCKRYILYRDSNCEVRVQEIDGVYEFERKTYISPLERAGIKIGISKGEFEWFAKSCLGVVDRDEFSLGNGLSVKIYGGKYTGLARVEVEFDSLDSLKKFVPPEWVGAEITDSPLGQDGALIQMSEKEFKIELSKYGGSATWQVDYVGTYPSR